MPLAGRTKAPSRLPEQTSGVPRTNDASLGHGIGRVRGRAAHANDAGDEHDGGMLRAGLLHCPACASARAWRDRRSLEVPVVDWAYWVAMRGKRPRPGQVLLAPLFSCSRLRHQRLRTTCAGTRWRMQMLVTVIGHGRSVSATAYQYPYSSFELRGMYAVTAAAEPIDGHNCSQGALAGMCCCTCCGISLV